MEEALLESETDIINLDALKTRLFGNLDLLERILKTFDGQVDADLNEFERAVLEADAEAAAFVSHRIKGMSSSIEAKRLYEAAALAEKLAREKRLEELSDSLDAMRRTRSELAEVLTLRSQVN